MEFKYRDDQNRRAPSPMPQPPSTVAYVSGRPLQGSIPGFVPAPSVFPTPLPVNANEAFRQELEKEHILRELEREEIRREIIANEIALARRREMEEEVKREMALERAFVIPMQRQEGISIPERVLMPFNPRMSQDYRANNNNIFRGPHFQLPNTNNAQTCRDQVILLAKPNADHYDAKRKAPAVDDNEHCSFSLQKKPKQGWSCMLCHITTTSEKGLNDHFQGKKHKAKEASLGTWKIGLDSRPDRKHFNSGGALDKSLKGPK